MELAMVEANPPVIVSSTYEFDTHHILIQTAELTYEDPPNETSFEPF